MWHTQTSVEVGYRYRQIVNKYAEHTCDDDVVRARLLGDFSMRGAGECRKRNKKLRCILPHFFEHRHRSCHSLAGG